MKPATVDDYISACPPDVQVILAAIRVAIREAAPGAAETISYGMPTFRLGGAAVHIGAFKTHIALFPPVRDPALKRETLRYQGENGNLRFPLDEPIPLALIGRIVEARVRDVAGAQAAQIARATAPGSPGRSGRSPRPRR